MTPDAFTEMAVRRLDSMGAIGGHFDSCCKRSTPGANANATLATIPAGQQGGASAFPALVLTCSNCGYTRFHFLGQLQLLEEWKSIRW